MPMSKDENKIIEEAIDSLDWDLYDKQAEEFREERAARGLNSARQDPDIPACDACGKDFSGNLSCASCQSVFYCSKECQRAAWKQGGHKQTCPTMKEDCDKMAEHVLHLMKYKSNDVGHTHYDMLDMAGPYKAAVQKGLHKELLKLFQGDIQEVHDWRHDTGTMISKTGGAMCSLFRGERYEGRGIKSRSFACCDGNRIRMYVDSHPRAFEAWWEASMATLLLALDDRVWRAGPGAHSTVRQHSRDTIAGWILVFATKSGSKAILLPNSPKEESKARAEYLANSIRKSMARFKVTAFSPERDPGGSLEGMLYQVAAEIDLRYQMFQMDIGFEKLLKIKGSKMTTRYKGLALPFAEATIAKGKSINMEEGQAAMQAHQARRR
jgi:hypothetical protein